ncbi:MAG: SLC13 family permease [Coxiellaceae bacterium]|nr:SLC13 family permease [Coxiellaceae bacterium]
MNHFSLPIALLLLVFIAIAIRKVGRLHLPIWLVMLVAAAIVMLTGHISLRQSYDALSFDVLFYLLGVFVIGQAIESSHYLEHVSLTIFRVARTQSMLLLMMIVLFALSSALLMNDTVAIIGTPLILLLAKQQRFDAKPYLLCLAYAITLGSVFSPVGNPQNLLIANSAMINPFLQFLRYLTLPTVINLAVMYVLMFFCFRKQLSQPLTVMRSDKTMDDSLARLSKISMVLLLLLILAKVLLACFSPAYQLPFGAIALVACLPIVLFSKRRFEMIKHLDWHTLLFFVGLFVFMKSVWLSSYFQALLAQSHIIVTHKAAVFSISVLLSQLISNVPLVALYLPLLKNSPDALYLALAAGSTVAGNLLILGAASNVIIIQNAEKRGAKAFTFLQFFKYGLPLTVINVLVYYWFLP